MSKLVLFNKPFNVLSQFTDAENRETLADYIPLKGVYPAGRLDRDSEGLMLLTDDGKLQAQISSPKFNKFKSYWVQLDGEIDEDALARLRNGVELKDGVTKPAQAKRIEEPDLWPRNPPVRFRANIPTSWIELSISEGKNRQVRRMTAAVGFPTLRLVRFRIDQWQLNDLPQGQYKLLTLNTPAPQKTRRKPQRTTTRKRTK